MALTACDRKNTESDPNYLGSSLTNASNLDLTPYVGVAHDIHRIVHAMALPSADWQVQSIQIGADHGEFDYRAYTLKIFYKPHSDFEGEIFKLIPEIFFKRIADSLLALIESFQTVTFSVNYTTDTYD